MRDCSGNDRSRHEGLHLDAKESQHLDVHERMQHRQHSQTRHNLETRRSCSTARISKYEGVESSSRGAGGQVFNNKVRAILVVQTRGRSALETASMSMVSGEALAIVTVLQLNYKTMRDGQFVDGMQWTYFSQKVRACETISAIGFGDRRIWRPYISV